MFSLAPWVLDKRLPFPCHNGLFRNVLIWGYINRTRVLVLWDSNLAHLQNYDLGVCICERDAPCARKYKCSDRDELVLWQTESKFSDSREVCNISGSLACAHFILLVIRDDCQFGRVKKAEILSIVGCNFWGWDIKGLRISCNFLLFEEGVIKSVLEDHISHVIYAILHCNITLRKNYQSWSLWFIFISVRSAVLNQIMKRRHLRNLRLSNSVQLIFLWLPSFKKWVYKD